MASSDRPTPKSGYWFVVLGLLSVAVVVVMALLVYMLLTLPLPAEKTTATPHRSELNLPTVAPPTTTPGPPIPLEVIFAAEEPIKGFSDCDVYGFKGMVVDSNGNHLKGIQVVAWEDQTGLLALDTTDANGNYLVKIQGKPAQHKLWVQLYRDDIPVSDPLLVKPHLDCQAGFQVYQIDWRELSVERKE